MSWKWDGLESDKKRAAIMPALQEIYSKNKSPVNPKNACVK
jgi:hypothetical protein